MNPFVSHPNEKTQLEAYRNIINSAGYAVVSYHKTKTTRLEDATLLVH